jgi:hypothetical protein
MAAIRAEELDKLKASMRLHYRSSRISRPPYRCCVAGGRAKNTAWAQEAFGSRCPSRNLCAQHEILVAEPAIFSLTLDAVGAV